MKKGSIASWAEIITLVLIFLFAGGTVIGALNADHSKSNNLPFGNQTTDIYKNMSSYTQSSRGSGGLGGTVTQTVLGTDLTTAWNLFKSFVDIIWDFIVGNWIPTTLGLIFPGFSGISLVGRILQAFYLIGIILGVVALIFRVTQKP